MTGIIKKMIITINGEDYLVTKAGTEDVYILDSLDSDNVKGYLVSGKVLKRLIAF